MIEVRGLAVHQGSFVLDDISFTVPSGAYGVLMGPSGAGKTSILEVICGLRASAAGQVLLSGVDVSGRRPGERGIGYVPQDRALFPTLTVRQQLAFALVVRRAPAAEIGARVDELAALLGIVHLLDRRPVGLSGGEAQRVTLGRALAARPQVLCLDEPLNALDDAIHEETCALLASVHRLTGVTVLHVTHSLREARRLGTRLLRLEGGAVREVSLDGAG
jgi:ABC-type sugar transport system ATPase subunit